MAAFRACEEYEDEAGLLETLFDEQLLPLRLLVFDELFFVES